MPSKIGDILGLTVAEQQKIDDSSIKLTTLIEWLTGTVEAAKDTPLWKTLGGLGESAKEWSGVVKAVSKFIEKLTKDTAPQTLGWLACTLAYRRASEEAIWVFGKPASRIPYSGQVVSERLANLRLEDPAIMKDFSLNSVAGHPFLRAADDALVFTLEIAGYDPAEQRNILREVRGSFKAFLQELLSGEGKDKFAPFTQWLNLDTDDRRLQSTLLAYIDRQRADFEDQPALGIEPFAISDVYIDTECGSLLWKTIRDGIEETEETSRKGIDPFAESSAKRQGLLDSVIGLMAEKNFNDCIVIQGAPGSGKSTFTKRLSIQLRKEGLIPLRIPLQYMRVDANIFDALQDVIVSYCGSVAGSFRRDLLREKVFSDQVDFGNGKISPYVFIFDGWDEISLSADEGFQQRVERLLDSIRQAFLSQNVNKVRVIITGRPSQAVGRTNFLRDATPVFTIRPVRPEQLDGYVRLLGEALSKPAFQGPEIDPWQLGDPSRYSPILRRYKKEFPRTGSLEVLGQPLLAHLAMKVMASFKGDLSELIAPPTTLYRHLVDLTCYKGGKSPTDESSGKSGRIEGKELRSLLHGTALAITAYGTESIPTDELEMRMETLGVGQDIFVTKKASPLARLANLMISFYFKGVQAQSGCEFLHKSFREYLAAEAIVEVLKEYGSQAKSALPQRAQYWQDFEASDLRSWLSRKLGEIFSAQWLSDEIVQHVSELLEWEIKRAQTAKIPAQQLKSNERSTDPISFKGWEMVRDGLSDLWDWWGEGVHLRPQPKERQKMWSFEEPPYVVELAKLAMRRSNFNRKRPPRPIRATTIDAHLGYALFQMNCFLHCFISEVNGWNEAVATIGAKELWSMQRSAQRPYQTIVEYENKKFIQFSPSGDSPDYFRNYIDRINGAGVRPGGRSRVPRLFSSDFPAGTMLRGADLEDATLNGVSFGGCDLMAINLQGSTLENADITMAQMWGANLEGANLYSASLYESNLGKAYVSGTNFFLADLRGGDLASVSKLDQMQLDLTGLGSVDGQLPEGITIPLSWKIQADVFKKLEDDIRNEQAAQEEQQTAQKNEKQDNLSK
jgi:NACHT domain/Pentapeptide repeats (8 copies)